MARKIIDIGTIGNDGTGDSIRDSFRKVNDNFRELYSSLGIGERLTFRGLEDTPGSYAGQENAILTVNNTETGLQFKQIVQGTGVNIDFTTNENEIIISSLFAEISGDPSPQLGGPLNTSSGPDRYLIGNLPNLSNQTEYRQSLDTLTAVHGISAADDSRLAVNKGYADSKLSRAGIDAIDPRTGTVNPDFGTMTGPLILSRDPEPSDDEAYDGLIAATKRYVDSSAFGSSVNLYVATSGRDERPGVSSAIQGRALAYAYRTFEAALKRAEELVLESRVELGPYKKVLTYGGGIANCTLTSIGEAPLSGGGFNGRVFLSIDTVRIIARGSGYRVGDIIRIPLPANSDPSSSQARLEVLSTNGNPGPILSVRIISTGKYGPAIGIDPENYNILSINAPGVSTSPSESQFGTGTRFDIVYKVSNIVVDSGGSDYGLVSVRIDPAEDDTTGTGSFGTADVVNGAVQSITVDDPGTGFTKTPTVVVSLPRFKIFTNGLRTDFTGDVENPDPIATRTRDIREGLYLRGETSGALCQILAHEGDLDGQDEIFDVDIKFGRFIPGEVISYGDVTKNIQISVLVESGVYEENFPLRIPQNVAIVGDEFRRVIVRPKVGESSSPWALLNFRRDTVIDGNLTATQLFGYHYLADSTKPVYPIVNNPGKYRAAAQLLALNKTFIQSEVIAWINNNIEEQISPFTETFAYDADLCERDVGLIIDSLIFDLRYGGYNRTISAALKYRGSASGLIAITDQLNQTVAAIEHINELAQDIILNDEVSPIFNTLRSQIIDLAFQSETGSGAVIEDLIESFIDIINGSLAGQPVNFPKDNDQIDAFLCNDGVILRAVTCQGQGGFSMVLDPEGQILAKSPYAQECASFSKSIGRKIFAGGMFVDGFTGNLQFRITERVLVEGQPSNNRLRVSGLIRFPQLPASFIVNDNVYRINYVRDFVFGVNGSTAQFVLDEVTPFTLPIGNQTVTVSPGNPGTFTRINHFLQISATIRFKTTGTFPVGIEKNNPTDLESKEYFVIANGFGPNTFRVTDIPGSSVGIEISTSGTGTLTFERIYEVLMPGNRSMLSNDFTQICDMGYGLLATNGGLTEAVSMFTYYCYTSYYSLNGGQIRSISGSSAHGVYGLVAEGSDPLEIPTPVTLYHDLSQGARCYAPSALFANEVGGLILFIYNYDYLPLSNSELEVIHSDGEIYRYAINSVDTTDLPTGVAKVTLSSTGNATTAGLEFEIPDNTPLTIRNNSQVVLTGDVVDVATRPSTALILNESSFVYRILQFTNYEDPDGEQLCSVSVGNPTVVTANGHQQLGGYIIQFVSTGTLPGGLEEGVNYYVLEENLTPNSFNISESKNGNPLAVTSSGTGTLSFIPAGLARTNLRENYDYVDLTVYQPNEFASTPAVFTVSIGSPAIFTSANHGLTAGSVIRLVSTGALPTGLTDRRHYHVISTGLTLSQFQVSLVPNGAAVETVGTQSGTHRFGLVKGRVGDSSFAVVSVGPSDEFRVDGYKFSWNGVVYTVINYESTGETGQPFARITLDKPIEVDPFVGTGSLLTFTSPPTLKAGVPKRTSGAAGSLTIRISLTRVTSHDMLEIGTGSYADTNYPNEIYGPAVNPLNDSNETQERGSGRTFYVTTDQFGNFRVGPFFRVDQGTGTVTFSASIALSNLDGLGFKRGVPIAEFSVDGTFSDNATDTVPTENATRTYIDKRLGVSHTGAILPDEEIIPPLVGGFLPISGILAMKADLNLANNKIINVSNPISGQDVVNLRSLTFANFQDTTVTSPTSGQLLSFTGTGSQSINVSITGDVTATRSGNNLNIQINADAITNADINASAGIDQSKLTLNSATTRVNATGITQADRGLASFDSGQFTATNGWITVRDNGLLITKIQQIAGKSVLGRPDGGPGNVSTILFDDVVSVGGGIKKSQYAGALPGGNKVVLVRNNSLDSTQDTSYERIGLSSVHDSDFESIVQRDGNGDYQGRIVTVQSIKTQLFNVAVPETTSTDTLVRVSSGTGGGTIRLFGFRGAGGIFIGEGPGLNENTTVYANDNHTFRNNANNTFAGIRCSTVTATAITTGSDTTSGTITGQWILSSTPGGASKGNSRLQATYAADLAEFYEGDKEYEVGTVLVFGGEKEVTISNIKADTRVAGVVSDNAAYSMYGACPGFKNQIALQGRVPCKVIGKISKGDLLTTSNIPGVAEVANDPTPGTLIGKALEDYDSDIVGIIEVAVGRV